MIRRALLGLAAGGLVAASVPPIGVWPSGIIGLALLYRAISWDEGTRGEGARRPGAAGAGRSRRRAWEGRLGRYGAGAVAGLGLFGVTLYWATEFSVPGYVLLVLVEAAFWGLAAAAVPRGRARLPGFVAAMVLASALRHRVPFGGMPLGGIFLGQVGGPLLNVARLGGPPGMVAVAAAAGAGLAEVEAALAARTPGPSGTLPVQRLVGPLSIALAAAVTLVGVISPSGGRPTGYLAAAGVQSGGERGTRAIYTNPLTVFRAQLAASAPLLTRPGRGGRGGQAGPGLVVFPEDVVALTRALRGSPQDRAMAGLARSLGATVVAGVTEPVGAKRFYNLAVAWSAAGHIVARYDKVHRVPFGEYIPLRGLLSHVVNLSAVPRNAIAGHGPGILRTPAGPLGTLISYEVFFADRGRDAVQAGGTVLLVPTNDSSYATDQVPAQELAASRAQAVEEGRNLLQVAPTGYSAVIDQRGRVQQLSVLGRRQVLLAKLATRTGRTLYSAVGDRPLEAAAAAVLLAAWAAALVPVRRSG
ncbi:MAG: apolipoprotein N-acyltransferase [Acidimicrobiales bacterium]